MRVELLGREGCCLCDEAAAELRQYVEQSGAASAGLEIIEVDIEADERLHREFLERIPVIRIEGEVISEFVFDPEAFDAAVSGQIRRAG